jgi:aldose sugar dehydrogenase
MRLHRLVLASTLLLLPALARGQTALSSSEERQAVLRTIQTYFDGWATGDTTLLGKAMHASCHLKRSLNGVFVDRTRAEYLAGWKPRARDSTLATRVAYLEIVGPIAQARAEISIGRNSYIDYFNLLKTAEGWFIVDKVSTQVDRLPSAPPEAAGSRSSVPRPRPVLVPVLDSLRRPWSMAFLSEDDVLISEKEGALLRVNLRSKQRVPVKGFPGDAASVPQPGAGDNTGKFDVLLDPEFARNRLLYLSYAATDGRGQTTKLVRARLDNDSLADVRELFVAAPYSADRVHYGGGLALGADGALYLTVGGRLFSEADEPPQLPISQNRRDRRGKIYRLRRDGSIPADNPDFGPGAVPGLFATGIRASQGLALHPQTGELWFSEHGTHQGDEINVLRAGANYGWPLRTTGSYRAAGYTPPPVSSPLTDPVWSWPQTVAPTGPVFYTGSAFPSWQQSLLVGGLVRGSLWRLTVDGDRVTAVEELLVDQRSRVRKVAQSPGGVLYLLTDYLNGQLLRLDNAAK